jgi:Fur family transcriptional regulator, ferric uptake regulator
MEAVVDLAKGRKPIEPEKLLRRDPVDPAAFRRMIRTMGLKVTQQRMAILETLSGGRAHVTAQEVFEIVNAKYPEIGFATVYRFLRKMNEQKMVSEVRMGGLPARYELTPRRHHDHLTCTQCGQIVEFENPQIENLQEQVAREHNFRLTHHVLELYGLCTRCQAE